MLLTLVQAAISVITLTGIRRFMQVIRTWSERDWKRFALFIVSVSITTLIFLGGWQRRNACASVARFHAGIDQRSGS